MKKIFKNMIPYWHMIIAIVLLLTVQAYCDLSLPQYTSKIIDTGIQNHGIAHILPQKITEEEYEYAGMFMTQEEQQTWEASYEKEDGGYRLVPADEKELDELDEELLIPILLNYRMANTSEEDFKNLIAQAAEAEAQDSAKSQAEEVQDSAKPQAEEMQDSAKSQAAEAEAQDSAKPQAAEAGAQHPVDPQQIADMSLEDIGQMMQIELEITEAEDEDGIMTRYVDMRPLMRQMAESGMLSGDMIQQSRESLEKMADSMGSSMLASMGIAYAIDCDTQAGLDIDKIQTSYLWEQGVKMLLMAVLMLAAAAGTGYLASKVGAGVGRSLRKNIFTRVVGFSSAEIDQFSTASLITRSTNDIQQVQMVTAIMLRMVLYAPILGIGGIYKVVQTGADMGWIIVLAVVLIIGFVMLLMSVAMPKFKAMQKLVDALNLVSREILTGLSVIRAFGREKTEEARFEQANRNLTKTQLFTNRVMTFMMPGMMMIMYGVTLLIVWVSAQRIDSGSMQVGAMTAFITYSMQIVMSFLMLTMMSIMLPRAGVAAERIDEVLSTETSIREPGQAETWNMHHGVVRFSHVSFRYPGANENVLDDIDFTAEPGKTTAVIGSTGCGKSTLVNLIPRFYDVTAGEITIDGRDIRGMSLKDLREGIGFVPQKGVLFSGTIASNLRFGKPDAGQELLEQAARTAQADDFIKEKADGYDSSIAQGGSNVSGGQKQRLAIARAIVKQPKIFVFDDSFSALDMKTDLKLRRALEPQVSDSTVIIVAQRISTIVHADQILVLDEGRIVGRGTHSQLMKECEVYQQIAHSQLSEKELAAGFGKEALA